MAQLIRCDECGEEIERKAADLDLTPDGWWEVLERAKTGGLVRRAFCALGCVQTWAETERGRRARPDAFLASSPDAGRQSER